jgi:hypothetical protein
MMKYCLVGVAFVVEIILQSLFEIKRVSHGWHYYFAGANDV